MKLNYVVEHTPNGDHVGTLGEVIKKYTSHHWQLQNVLVALIDLMPPETQYQLAHKLDIPVAELCPQAVSGDKTRAKFLAKMEEQYGKIGYDY